MSLDLEAAAVVVSVEGCRCAGVCLRIAVLVPLTCIVFW